ncbi:polysaccharide deacetylase WbmS family protein [Pseudomonas oryziphila]|uniref:Polysaccharide deacetylase n=1 Tax=Pseudomonas oryziphila TaxID=2894079 RepID=A0ABN5TFM6_9PSED|nr:hypothetical protein [Pseudomonas oryziphila]AZL72917.1 hypothetical protein EI693_07325 [Pseudomonas oryziphila]
MANPLHLTLDVDWAPDVVIDHVAELILAQGVKATWFVTHWSPAIERLAQHPAHFELGIHPNFLKGSSHGESVADVVAFCRDMLPKARSVRTHSLCMNGEIMAAFCRSADIGVDSSLFMPGVETIEPFVFETAAGRVVRVPVYWSDDYQLAANQANFTLPQPAVTGVKVFMFHPIHVFLNSPDFSYYESRKGLIFSGAAEPEQLATVRHPGEGVGSSFEVLLRLLKNNGGGGHMSDFCA